MNEQRNNGRGIFYGVIGVATLVVAIIGATFAYFTASASNNNTITGNMATVQLSLAVEKVVKVDEDKEGMIPMSNGMVQQATASTKGTCIDDNGNAVCQVYKITLTNDSSAGQFVDGYVSLKGGSAAPTDIALVKDADGEAYSYVEGAKFKVATEDTTAVGTTMRWAQVFATGEGTATTYSTAGTQTLSAKGDATTSTVTMSAIGAATATASDAATVTAAKAHNIANIRNDYSDFKAEDGNVGVLSSATIAGTPYDVIGTNYIRLSNHDWTKVDAQGNQTYKREDDVTSALVFNNSVAAGDAVSYYIVVWLSETGTNQTAGVTNEGVTNPAALKFFTGNVTFVSAQGSEVSATFSGYSRVSSQKTTPGQQG